MGSPPEALETERDSIDVRKCSSKTRRTERRRGL